MTQAYNLSQLANKVNTSGQLDVSTGITGTIATTNLPTIPVSKGGTNLTATPTNGQLPIGNGTNYTLATLTSGTGISITNTSGGITIASTISSGGMTLLGTLSFSSGTSQTISGLTLTTYKQIQFVINGVSISYQSQFILNDPSGAQLIFINIVSGGPGTSQFRGIGTLDLSSGILVSNGGNTVISTSAGSISSITTVSKTTFSTSSTSFTFTNSTSSSFNGGTLLVYGIQ